MDLKFIKMNNKYTAIYNEIMLVGSHTVSITKMKRIETIDGESILEMMIRENLYGKCCFLFVGHPQLEGEYNET